MIVRATLRFRCNVLVEKDGELAHGKSLMELLMLGAGSGTRLRVRAAGDDAVACVSELATLFATRSGEE
jgi:phosphocarrier protein HPr